MMKEVKIGCGVPKDPVKVVEPTIVAEPQSILKEEQNMIKVGKPAPNFSAQAFHEGKFVNVSLEDYKGKWVYLCFYPGDFTFV